MKHIQKSEMMKFQRILVFLFLMVYLSRFLSKIPLGGIFMLIQKDRWAGVENFNRHCS